MESLVPLRNRCLVECNNGTDSLADMEAGYLSSSHSQNHKQQNNFFSRFLCYTRNSGENGSSRNLCSRSRIRFYESRFEQHEPHFLDACFLCRKPLGNNQDIFMYRGDVPFCSEECRYKQIVVDEVNEKRLKLSATLKALRNKEQSKSTSAANADAYNLHTGTVTAA
ncbi:hypothetical protein HRI_005177900 [Hibiscus trionum]|uniref:FLZ-type domain-containing protein n=1 Tax=Hibiscus trionum TaxID=183268 RepID=A0A9W7MVC5_HIBTR|nr:hypothetical protein HRI_005177900 [Hibiscus trionum]